MRNPATTLLLAAGLLAVASCGGSKGTASKKPDGPGASPAAFFEAYKAASVAGDVNAVWSMLTKATQDSNAEQVAEFRAMEGAAGMLDITGEELAKMSDPNLARLLMRRHLREEGAKIGGTKMDRVEQLDADKAIIHTTDPNGKTSRGVVVRVGGAWKLDLLATKQLEGDSDEPEQEPEPKPPVG